MPTIANHPKMVPGVQVDSSVAAAPDGRFRAGGGSAVLDESSAGFSAESTAALVRSSESGHRCEYVSSVSAALACPSRAWTVLTDSPCRMSRLA
jgi:hypothetical protein